MVYRFDILQVHGNELSKCNLIMQIGSTIGFTKFDNGKIAGAEGEIVEIQNEFVVLNHELKNFSFKRLPGPKSGWGVGASKNWRLNQPERAALCHVDIPRRK